MAWVAREGARTTNHQQEPNVPESRMRSENALNDSTVYTTIVSYSGPMLRPGRVDLAAIIHCRIVGSYALYIGIQHLAEKTIEKTGYPRSIPETLHCPESTVFDFVPPGRSSWWRYSTCSTCTDRRM